jgi:4-amino-4-deoxy-L-arabinose transferase-like glycosyltransferase
LRGIATYRNAAILLFGLGIWFRIVQFAANRALWLDEALLAPAIVEGDLGSIFDLRRWGPIAPGFILLSRLSVSAFGDGELALRLVPLLAGLASLPLFWMLAGRILSRKGRLFAFAVFALLPFGIYYASELKPYATDLAATLLLLLGAVTLSRRAVRGRETLAWAAASLVLAFFALPAALVAAGATLGLIVARRRAGDRTGVRWLTGLAAAGAAAAAIPYLLFVRGSAANPYLQAFWESGFMPLPPTSLTELAWFPSTFARTFRDPLGIPGGAGTASGHMAAAAGMLVFTAGLVWLARRRPGVCCILVLPVAVALIVSAARVYPFGGDWQSGGRVILFLTPMFALVMGEGAERLRRVLRRPLRPLAAVLVAMLLVPSLAWGLLAVPTPRAEIRPILEYVRENWRPGDVLYVHYDVKHTFGYYGARYGLGGEETVAGPCAREEPTRYLAALDALRGAPRVWILFGAGMGAARFDEKALMSGYLEHVGRRLDDQVSFGTTVYLYDLRPGEAEPGRFQARIPSGPVPAGEGCLMWE